ncbi:hypothetical protein AJ87_28810 [Rhizobium yanglingense]|nr:hypothetical protein AJ87_28810 [Rhizobium yanglingense]
MAKAALADVQRLYGIEQGPLRRLHFFDSFARRIEMLGNQPVAKRRYRPPVSSTFRLDRQVAFRIESLRTIVEIRRADANETVVDDDKLEWMTTSCSPPFPSGTTEYITRSRS